MSQESLRTGDKANVLLKFLKRPEVIKIGQKFIFRDGRTKAVGIVTDKISLKNTKLWNYFAENFLYKTFTVLSEAQILSIKKIQKIYWK